MSLNYRPITGKWTLPSDGVPGRAVATLQLVAPDWTPDAFVVPDLVRVVADADGDVVPAPGYVGATVEVDGKDRAVVWSSEDGERQVLYLVTVEGSQSRTELASVLIPSGTEPLTLQQILELGIDPADPRYLTILSFIEALFQGDWNAEQAYSRGQQVRRGSAVYIASEDIPAGVDPLLGAPWLEYLIDAGIPPHGDTDAVLVKLSPTSGDAGWTNEPKFRRVSLDTANPGTLDAAGDLAWDDLDQTLSFRTDGLTVDLAQENLVYVRNPPGGSTIPKGAVVAVAGASSNRVQVGLCSATAGGDGCRTLGVVMGAIPSPGFGFVSTFGLLRDFDTGTITGTVTEGAEVFVSPTPGVLTTTVPTAPARKVLVGYVVTTGASGSIFITVRRSRRVDELDNVNAPSPSDKTGLRYNAATSRYEAFPLGSAASTEATDYPPIQSTQSGLEELRDELARVTTGWAGARRVGVNQSAYTVSNDTPSRTLNVTSYTDAEVQSLANIVATLIRDLGRDS
jgi:hypothetical protein